MFGGYLGALWGKFSCLDNFCREFFWGMFSGMSGSFILGNFTGGVNFSWRSVQGSGAEWVSGSFV